jgi:hypothetical protein
MEYDDYASTPNGKKLICAYPGCAAVITVAESTYVDGCGRICRRCEEAMFGPRPDWWDDIEPPF